MSDAAARELTELVLACIDADVKSDDVAAAAAWSLANGGLSEAHARQHAETLRGRLSRKS